MEPCGHRRATIALLAALTISACRFGGPSGDPTAYGGDASAVGGSSGRAGSSGEGGSGGSGGSGASGGTGGTGATAGTGTGGGSGATGGANPGGAGGAALDASDDRTTDGAFDADDDVARDGSADVDADSESDGVPPTGCVPPFMSAVCDPVCNTGCPALLRCDVTVDLQRTGVCVGTLLSTVGEGMPCTRSAVTDDCLDRLTCFEGTCRRLCYRDTECTAVGSCCNTSIDVDGGASGYRVCAPCAP